MSEHEVIQEPRLGEARVLEEEARSNGRKALLTGLITAASYFLIIANQSVFTPDQSSLESVFQSLSLVGICLGTLPAFMTIRYTLLHYSKQAMANDIRFNMQVEESAGRLLERN